MPLAPPTYVELENFQGEKFPEDQVDFVTSTLQAATDALWIFTGADEYPQDPRMARIYRYAIMDLTLWLLSQNEHRTEINSPFSSERIGSYSYSKMQAAQRGETTGIYWLDLLFKLLLNDPEGGSAMAWSSSEKVFNPGGLSFEEQTALEKFAMQDPSEPWGFF